MRKFIDIVRLAETASERKIVTEDFDYAYDPDENFKPRPMKEPKVLYRSVSIPELVHIWEHGSVTGGLNRFNDWDKRRVVFFGDKLNDQLIWQGEEIERQAVHAMTSEPLHAEFQVLLRDLQEREEDLAEIARQGVKVNREASPEAEAIYQRLEADWRDTDAVAAAYRWVDFKFRDQYRAIQRKIGDILRDMDRCRKEYRQAIKAKAVEVKAARDQLPITSAVLVTKPLLGGAHYSKAWGQAGMGDDDEFGFRSGQVRYSDIADITLIRDGKVVGHLDPESLGGYLAKIGLPT